MRISLRLDSPPDELDRRFQNVIAGDLAINQFGTELLATYDSPDEEVNSESVDEELHDEDYDNDGVEHVNVQFDAEMGQLVEINGCMQRVRDMPISTGMCKMDYITTKAAGRHSVRRGRLGCRLRIT